MNTTLNWNIFELTPTNIGTRHMLETSYRLTIFSIWKKKGTISKDESSKQRKGEKGMYFLLKPTGTWQSLESLSRIFSSNSWKMKLYFRIRSRCHQNQTNKSGKDRSPLCCGKLKYQVPVPNSLVPEHYAELASFSKHTDIILSATKSNINLQIEGGNLGIVDSKTNDKRLTGSPTTSRTGTRLTCIMQKFPGPVKFNTKERCQSKLLLN